MIASKDATRINFVQGMQYPNAETVTAALEAIAQNCESTKNNFILNTQRS